MVGFLIENKPLGAGTGLVLPGAMGVNDFGDANGYVILNPGHPLYGVDYADIDDIHAHGGLTFAGNGKQFAKSDILTMSSNRAGLNPSATAEMLVKKLLGTDVWVLGFDTRHHGDDSFTCPMQYVLEETHDLRLQIQKKYAPAEPGHEDAQAKTIDATDTEAATLSYQSGLSPAQAKIALFLQNQAKGTNYER
jgi:hypothetical protein